MKKTFFIIFTMLFLIGGVVGSLVMMSKMNNSKHEKENNEIEISDKVTDECIEEYDNLQTEQTQVTNTEDVEKVSPNAVITQEKYYKDCEHIVKKYEKVPSSLVNATKEEVEAQYSDWKIKDFSKENIVLYQEVDGECGEHYMLRDVDGKINVYQLDENGNETLLNETDIATEYLTSTDMINMENGLIVYGKENLNKLLEDFE